MKKIEILSLVEYMDSWPVPKSSDSALQDRQLQMFIDDATNQIDNLCGGLVFKKLETLDEIKLYKLKRAIGDLTLLLDQTGKMYYDGSSQGGGSAPFSLSSTSSNSSVEFKRQDIIKNLIEIGFYSNVTLQDKSFRTSNVEPNKEFEELVKKLSGFFLSKLGTNNFEGEDLVFTQNNNIKNTGDITGATNVEIDGVIRKPKITGYDIAVEIDTVTNALKIYDSERGLYSDIHNVLNLAFYGPDGTNAATKNYVSNAVVSGNLIWNPSFEYQVGFIVSYATSDGKLASAESLVTNNVGNNPNTSAPGVWKIYSTGGTDVNAIIEAVLVEVRKELEVWERVMQEDFQLFKDGVNADIGAFKTDVNDEIAYFEEQTNLTLEKFEKVTLPNEVGIQLRQLNTLEFISEFKDELVSFKDDADTNSWLAATGLQASDLELQAGGGGGDSTHWVRCAVSYLYQNNIGTGWVIADTNLFGACKSYQVIGDIQFRDSNGREALASVGGALTSFRKGAKAGINWDTWIARSTRFSILPEGFSLGIANQYVLFFDRHSISDLGNHPQTEGVFQLWVEVPTKIQGSYSAIELENQEINIRKLNIEKRRNDENI